MTTTDTSPNLQQATQRCKAAEDACVGCAEDTKISEKDSGRDPSYLFELDTEFLYIPKMSVLQNPDEACKMARVAFEVVHRLHSHRAVRDSCG